MSAAGPARATARAMAALAPQCEHVAARVRDDVAGTETAGPASQRTVRDLTLAAAAGRMAAGWLAHWPAPDPRLRATAQRQAEAGGAAATALAAEVSGQGRSKELWRRWARPRPLEERLQDHEPRLRSHLHALRLLLDAIERWVALRAFCQFSRSQEATARRTFGSVLGDLTRSRWSCGDVASGGHEPHSLGLDGAPLRSKSDAPASIPGNEEPAHRPVSPSALSERTLVAHASPDGPKVADKDNDPSIIALSQLELADSHSPNTPDPRPSGSGAGEGPTDDQDTSEYRALNAIVAQGGDAWVLDLALRAGRVDILTTLLADLPAQEGPGPPLSPRSPDGAGATTPPSEFRSPAPEAPTPATDIPPSPTARLAWRRAALLHACAHGPHATVQLLLDLGASPETREVPATVFLSGPTALHVAARHGQTAIARLLLARGARPHAQCTGLRHPLHEAAAGGHVEVVRVLLEAGAAVAPRDESGYRPLHAACAAGSEGVARLLLERGASVDVVGNDRFQALHHAALDGGSAGLVRLLVEWGADVNAVQPLHGSPLAMARRAGHKDVVTALLEAAAEEEPAGAEEGGGEQGLEGGSGEQGTE